MYDRLHTHLNQDYSREVSPLQPVTTLTYIEELRGVGTFPLFNILDIVLMVIFCNVNI